MNEEWRPVPGYGGHYEASSLGRIRRKKRVVRKFNYMAKRVIEQTYQELILSPHAVNKYGHRSVHIGVDGKRTMLSAHRAVLLAFVGPCPEGFEACHNDGDATNNRPENLRWDTHLSNNQDRKRHGRYASGADHWNHKSRRVNNERR